LYDIIRRAQTSTHGQRTQAGSPSSGALFSAYNQVIAELDLGPSDDAVLHRFLFRMQKDRRHGEDILQRFKRVLGELDIQIEVDEEGEGVEVTSNLDTARNPTRNGAVAALGRHSRRGSFDSFFDNTGDKVAGNDFGDLPLRPRRGSTAGAPNGYAGYAGPRRVRSDTEANLYQQAQLPVRNGMNGYAHHRSASGQQRQRPKRSASVSSHGSLQIHRNPPTATSRVGDYDVDDSDHTGQTTSLDLSHIQVPGINAPIPDIYDDPSRQHHQYAPEPFRPSDTRMLDDAEILNEQRLHRVTRDCIQTWRNRTQERLSQRGDMEQLAVAFDRRILLRLSFEQLRDTARLRQSGRETERFFGRLEERADRARNIFLLTKAFTHWAKSAEDEVQRTSVARRHILRTRFFNGWRDITAVNELKVQHFVLARFLRQWRARTATVVDNTRSAVLLYEDNLVRRVYKEWFFKFCAIAAPAWRNDRMRRITLHKMVEIARVMRERQEWAVDRYQRGILKRTLQHWRGETATIQTLGPRANDFRRTSLISSALEALRKRTQLEPLLRQFQGRVDGRIVRSFFPEWKHAAQLSRQARNVDQMRILRNAYTAWNDRLRIQALEDRINDRIIVESLYKWTLASRVSLFQRVHDRQLKESTFLTWVTKTNQRTNTIDAAERRFAQFKRTQLLRKCLNKMEAITMEKRAEEFAVVAHFQQKLKQRIFDKLKERHAHFQQLNTWADAAQFYVLSKSTLKTWSAATQLSRRNRRRDTYSQVRRTVKTNLVRRMFTNWKDKSSHIAQLNNHANDMLIARTSQSSASLLHHWHDRTITLRQLDTQATNLHAYKLQSHSFHTWSKQLETLQTMDAQAVTLRQESAELAATSALKKLGWRLWNIQRQEENARALYERNFEKHVRAMIRFWAEQMSERLANRPVSPTPRSRSRRSRDDDDDGDGDDQPPGRGQGREDEDEGGGNNAGTGDETHALETWTPFDPQTLDLGLNRDEELDLSLSITPAPKPRSIFRQSTRPQTIPEDSILDPAFAADLDAHMANPSAFFANTPLPPTQSKPGYLKTPSKRSVVRAKRAASPDKRAAMTATSPEKRGVQTAPVMRRVAVQNNPGVTSFEKRLRDGGYGRSVAPVREEVAVGRGVGRESERGLSRTGYYP
jgi:protein SFI1